MMSVLLPLQLSARWGRVILVLGLLVGILLPGLALTMRDYLPELLMALLFFAALRIGPTDALGNLNRIGPLFVLICSYQVLLPCAAALLFMLVGWSGVLPSALILMMAAAPISGSPNLTVMVGGDPAPSLRLLVAATALLPLSVVPVFALSPLFGSAAAIFEAALRLLLIIVLSSMAAFAVRRFLLPKPSADALQAIDGISAILMAVLVVGLMSAFGPALTQQPLRLLQVLGLAFAVNIGLQIAGRLALEHLVRDDEKTAYAVGFGNRNMALFIAALPAAVTDPLLLYVACYQIPMYLTPYILGRFYKQRLPAA